MGSPGIQSFCAGATVGARMGLQAIKTARDTIVFDHFKTTNAPGTFKS